MMWMLFLVVVLVVTVPVALAHSAHQQRRARRQVARGRLVADAESGNEDFVEVIGACHGRHPIETNEARNR